MSLHRQKHVICLYTNFLQDPTGKVCSILFQPVKRRLPLSAQKLGPGSCPFITKAPLRSNLTNLRPVVNSYRNYLINFHWKSSNWFLRELSIGVGWINTPGPSFKSA